MTYNILKSAMPQHFFNPLINKPPSLSGWIRSLISRLRGQLSSVSQWASGLGATPSGIAPLASQVGTEQGL